MIHRHTEMTRERISFTFDPRDMLLSLQMGFSFVRAAVACAIIEIIVQSLREPLVWSYHLKQLLQGTSNLLQCPTSVLLPLSLSGCHWHCLASV